MRTKTTYLSFDNKEFTSVDACETYEREQQKKDANSAYFRVHYSPDLTEGRGYYNQDYFKIFCDYKWIAQKTFEAAMFVYAMRNLSNGTAIESVQGCVPICSFSIIPIDKKTYYNGTPKATWVANDYEGKKHSLILTKKGEVIEDNTN